MKRNSSILLLLVAFFSFAPAAFAQSAATSLANLPDADMLIYVSPQRILRDAVPNALPPAEVVKMQAAFADMKRAVGVDPSTVEYIVFALRFHKPGADLSFVAPDVMLVAGGDFSSESLLTLAQLSLQDKVRTEKHGAKTIAIMKIDEIAKEAAKNPIFKPYIELAAVSLSPNSLAIGNLRFINDAVAAADGTGRIKPETVQSLMRDPNVLIATTGAPLVSLARSFGLFGTETTPRQSSCDSTFGNFYSSVTMSGANYRVRGAMNADNPDTAKIITTLLSGLMQQAISSVPDKNTQIILQTFKMEARDSEVVIQADVPAQMVADVIREQSKPKADAPATTAPKKTTRPPARKTRRRN